MHDRSMLVQAKVEIVVTEGELGETVVATVNQLGATTLVVGLHDKSFLFRYGERARARVIDRVRISYRSGHSPP